MPSLTCNQAWLGNPDFATRVEDAIGGGVAFVLYSLAEGATTFAGAPSWIDSSQLFHIGPILLDGAPGVPGAGSGESPLPITLSPSPSKAGKSFYAQALVADYPDLITLVPAVTPGLEIELTMPPQVAAGSAVFGNSDPFFLIDPMAAAVQLQGQSPETNDVSGLAYAEAGTQLYVVSSEEKELNLLDLASPVPSWSPVFSFPGFVFGAEYDRERKLLWTLGEVGFNLRELLAIDVDPDGAFGSLAAFTSGASSSGFIESWALSHDGRRAAVVLSVGTSVLILDTDPDSPTYLQKIDTLAIPLPFGSFFVFPADVEFAPDGTELLVLIEHLGLGYSELARYDFEAGSWIDHAPGTPGVDNVGPNATPAVALGCGAADISVPRDASVAGICGDCGWAGIVQLAPDGPDAFTYLPATGADLAGAAACALDSDATRLAVSTGPPYAVHVFDTADATWKSSVSLPAATGKLSQLGWR